MTPKQAQFLKTRFAIQITDIEAEIKDMKEYAASLYTRCDKAFPKRTDSYFRALNTTRDMIRQAEKERNALAELQKIVKQLAKGF